MTATVDSPAVAPPKERKPLFGKQEKRAVLDPLWDHNPIALQVLGICSALAVTVKLAPTLAMCAAVIVVLCASNVVISLMRRMIPSNIRIIIMLTVISSLVTIVGLVLNAFMYDVSKQISVFIALIVTNCIVLGRAEAFAMANGPWRSFLDGLGNALGYAWILIMVAVVREIGGSGKLLDMQVIPASWYSAGVSETGYVNNGLMVLAPGAFILLGVLVWVQRSISNYTEEN